MSEKEVTHYPATASNINHQPDIQLIHMSEAASGDLPKIRKTRGAPIGRPDVGAPPEKPDKAALTVIESEYTGKRKPALVLAFHMQKNGGYFCNLGEVRISVSDHGGGRWRAFLSQKQMRWSRKKKDFVISWRQLLSSVYDDTAARAVAQLSKRDGWFYHNSYWRSLSWVYRSVITLGLGADGEIPKENKKKGILVERGVRSGHNLPHIQGYWLWERDSVPEVSQRVIELPSNEGLSRTPPDYDLRNEMSFDPDDKHGKPVMSRDAYDNLGRPVKLDDKIAKAPKPRKPSGKDINPARLSVKRESPPPMIPIVKQGEMK